MTIFKRNVNILLAATSSSFQPHPHDHLTRTMLKRPGRSSTSNSKRNTNGRYQWKHMSCSAFEPRPSVN